MSFLRIVLTFAVVVSIAIIGFLIGGYLWFSDLQPVGDLSPKLGEKKIEVEIASGSSPKEIATQLKSCGVIKSAFLFKLKTTFYGIDKRLKPGKYLFKQGESIEDILYQLLKGHEELIKVTIPEGLTLSEVAKLVENAGLASAARFLEKAQSPDLRKAIFSNWGDLPSIEGLTFPETYSFSKTVTIENIITTMLKLTRDKVDRMVAGTIAPTGLTKYETCILASIIEREAKLPAERPLVASVFLNRLHNGMRLESCATVQYALPEHKERLTFEDLKIQSPYNTYQRVGLPPTPISNFGEASLRAAVFPATSDYLFFVSDGADGHHFSTTLADHDRSRKEFLKQKKKNSQ